MTRYMDEDRLVRRIFCATNLMTAIPEEQLVDGVVHVDLHGVTIGSTSSNNVFGDTKVLVGVDGLKLVSLVLLQEILDARDGSEIVIDCKREAVTQDLREPFFEFTYTSFDSSYVGRP